MLEKRVVVAPWVRNAPDFECVLGVVGLHGLMADGAADFAERSCCSGVRQASQEVRLLQVFPIWRRFRPRVQCKGVDYVAKFLWEVHEAERLLRASKRVVFFDFMFWAASAEIGRCRLCVTRSCFLHAGVWLWKVCDRA